MSAETAIAGELPRWALMWLLAGGLFFFCKVAVARCERLRGWRAAGFTLAWVGMDAEPFRADAKRSGTGRGTAWLWPLTNTVLGCAILWGVARHFTHPLAAGWVGMVGLILILHFGTFGLLANAWRWVGVPVTPIMHCPIAATSVSEFWGKRWNLAFRDLAHRFVFKPVSARWGNTAALWASFAASGLAHEMVVSVPASAGFGLPLAYFLLQALGVTLERKVGRRVRSPLVKWLRTHAFTALPAFFLFHPPFVERVMVPFFRDIGALP